MTRESKQLMDRLVAILGKEGAKRWMDAKLAQNASHSVGQKGKRA